VNGPPAGPLTVPTELNPSPQLIVAVKSAVVPNGLASVTPATGPLNDCGDTGEAAQLAAIVASATFAVEVAVAVLLGVSVSVIVTVIA
jgi:hypothetical protein